MLRAIEPDLVVLFISRDDLLAAKLAKQAGISGGRGTCSGPQQNKASGHTDRSKQYSALFSDVETCHAIERQRHPQVGRSILENWNMSPDVVEAVGDLEEAAVNDRGRGRVGQRSRGAPQGPRPLRLRHS